MVISHWPGRGIWNLELEVSLACPAIVRNVGGCLDVGDWSFPVRYRPRTATALLIAHALVPLIFTKHGCAWSATKIAGPFSRNVVAPTVVVLVLPSLNTLSPLA